MTNTIYFYSTHEEYGEFSNFARYPIRIKKKWWPTTEHYFQAQKFAKTRHEGEVKRAKSPSLAARMGRDRKRPLRRDWESVKVGIMREALRAKFTQYVELGQMLLATGDATIIEHTASDSYWGDGGNGSGKNMLGLLLMEIRGWLRD